MDARVAMNGRRQHPLIDPEADLGEQIDAARQATEDRAFRGEHVTQIGEYLGDEITIAFQPCKGFCGVFIADEVQAGLVRGHVLAEPLDGVAVALVHDLDAHHHDDQHQDGNRDQEIFKHDCSPRLAA